jgi:hypothetical protein
MGERGNLKVNFLNIGNINPIQIQAILWKTGHTKGRSLTGEGGQKKEVKKMNMVEVLPIQKWI